MMAPVFHVFVEGAKDASPGALQRLAEAMATHYGIPAAELAKRLATGRFRVKGNVDRATADRYAQDLDRLGARCVIEPADGRATPPAGMSALSLATPPAGLPVVSRTETPPQRPSQQQYQSGLSAAFSSEPAPASAGFGALEKGDGALSLASVDGSDSGGGQAADASFAPPDAGGLPASIGPAPEKPKAKPDKPAKAAKPKDEPVDLFIPPEQQGEEMKVELASDEVDRSARKRASTPPAGMQTAAGAEPVPAVARTMTPPPRKSQPSIPAQTPPEGVAVAAPSGNMFADGRVRFAAGVLLAIILGFVPAHFVAAMREKSSFDEIDNNLISAQNVTSMDEYATLDQLRDQQLDRKKSSRRTIAIMAFVIWGAAGAGVAYVWFRRIPWARVTDS